MTSQQDKCEVFSRLHDSGTFIIPNPWDAGSARLLQGMGFKALATTSAGFAYGIGKSDGDVTLTEKLDHCSALVAATDLPVNADFENGFADGPEAVATNVAMLIETGIAGCSIEDFSRDDKAIYPFELAVERIQAAREAINASRVPVLLTARAENLLRGVSDLDDTVNRLQAFSKAGADVLYAPGIGSLDDLKHVTGAIDRPFNVLGPMLPGATVADFAAAGARRISVGSALTWLTLKPLIDAGTEMLEHGTFTWTANMVSGARVNALLST